MVVFVPKWAAFNYSFIWCTIYRYRVELFNPLFNFIITYRATQFCIQLDQKIVLSALLVFLGAYAVSF